MTYSISIRRDRNTTLHHFIKTSKWNNLQNLKKEEKVVLTFRRKKKQWINVVVRKINSWGIF